MIWSREKILAEFDRLRARLHELSAPEICDAVARSMGLDAEVVADVVANRDGVAA